MLMVKAGTPEPIVKAYIAAAEKAHTDDVAAQRAHAERAATGREGSTHRPDFLARGAASAGAFRGRFGALALFAQRQNI